MTESQWKDLRDAERDIRRAWALEALAVAFIVHAFLTLYQTFSRMNAFTPVLVIEYSALLLYWCFVIAELHDARAAMRLLVRLYIERDVLESRGRTLLQARDALHFQVMRSHGSAPRQPEYTQ